MPDKYKVKSKRREKDKGLEMFVWGSPLSTLCNKDFLPMFVLYRTQIYVKRSEMAHMSYA